MNITCLLQNVLLPNERFVIGISKCKKELQTTTLLPFDNKLRPFPDSCVYDRRKQSRMFATQTEHSQSETTVSDMTGSYHGADSLWIFKAMFSHCKQKQSHILI